MRTRSAYMCPPWSFEVRSVDLPDTPPPGEILVQVEACGVCGSDMNSAAATTGAWQAFGHEVAGVVRQAGAGVTNVAPGQRVVLESSSFCGTCALCRNGRVDLCNKAPNFWGRPAMGFSTFMLAPACCAVPYEGLDPVLASLTEAAGVAFDMVKTAGVQLGDRVALIGPGPIGLMAIPLLLRSGAARVLCMGRSRGAKRLEAARALGAETLAVDGALDGQTSLLKGFNHVLVTAPVSFIPPALSLLAYGGVLTYIGIGTSGGQISFDANDFHFRKLQLRASFASPAIYFPVVLELLRTGIIPGGLIVSHRFGLDQIDAAMKAGRDHKAETIKVVVTP